MLGVLGTHKRTLRATSVPLNLVFAMRESDKTVCVDLQARASGERQTRRKYRAQAQRANTSGRR